MRRSLHYGWVIVATGALVLFACLGLARYAYTMLLPGMSAELHLPYARMGLISTGNFAGYFVAVLCVPRLLRRIRPRPLIVCGLLLIAAGMFGMSRSSNFAPLFVLYALVGVGGGFANIPLMTVVTRWFRSRERGRAAGLVIAGNGAAIVFAGLLIPWLNRSGATGAWRSGWLILAFLALAVAALAGLFLRNDPAELGLEPIGSPPAGSVDLQPHDEPGLGRTLLFLGLLYALFGLTFMVFGTFIVTTMVREFNFSEARAGFYWSWVGFFSIFSGILFGTLSDRIGRRRGFAIVFAVQSLAYALAGFSADGTFLPAAIVLYGLTVFAIPSIMTAAVADYFGLSRAAAAFATVTLFFAVGQILGPGSAGFLAGLTGSFAQSYRCAALLAGIGALAALRLPPPARR